MRRPAFILAASLVLAGCSPKPLDHAPAASELAGTWTCGSATLTLEPGGSFSVQSIAWASKGAWSLNGARKPPEISFTPFVEEHGYGVDGFASDLHRCRGSLCFRFGDDTWFVKN